jgi:hypothetical protein
MDDEPEQMPFIFRITSPLAKMKMKALGFDRRKRESKIYEYAIHRYYMDFIEVFMAASIIVIRIYLAYDFSQPFSGTVPLNGSDIFVFILTISTLIKNIDLIKDYKKNVIQRIEVAAKKK